MPYQSVSGTRIYYEERGSSAGRPLLLLHASLQTGQSMAPVADLAEPLGYRIIAPDMRAHGRTANPGVGLTIQRLGDDLVEFMDGVRIKSPVVAGFSLGGTVAVELARRGLVSGLVVLAGRITGAGRPSNAFDPDDIRRRSPQWAEHLAATHVETSWADLARELGGLFADWPGFTQADLEGISCPTLVVQGEKDAMVPVEQSRTLAEAVQGAQLHLSPHANHPELLYRQDAMKVVARFLASLQERGVSGGT